MFKLSQKLCAAFTFLTLAAFSSAQSESLRDPTQPLGHSGGAVIATQKPLRLQSVLVSGSRKLAYINGQQVREQDLLKSSNGIKVIRIDSEGVTLQQGERRWRLTLNKVSVRQ